MVFIPTMHAATGIITVIRYNMKFNVGETGWICNGMYMTLFDAASNIAADTAYQLYTDQRVIRCVRVLMNQKVK